MKVCGKSCPKKLCNRKIPIYGVSLGRIMFCLQGMFLVLWVIPTGSLFLFRKVRCWQFHKFKLNFIYLVDTI